MKNSKMKLQIKACDYMEKTFGKDWNKKNIHEPSISNAYIQGYRDKEQEDRTIREIRLSPKRYEWFKDQLNNLAGEVVDDFKLIRSFTDIIVIPDRVINNDLGVAIDSNGDVVSFIEFKGKI